MKLRQMATAFIKNDGKFAMMKKKRNEFFDFEFWTSLGGHLESNEINNPREACIREIFEESGLQEMDLKELELKYILFRQKEDEIRIQYVFFGRTDKSELISSDEGELHWINETEIKDLNISTIIRGMLEHHSRNKNENHIFIGTLTRTEQEEPSLQWTIMKDPLIF
jgi:8-oxo-dGTP diphosphatase